LLNDFNQLDWAGEISHLKVKAQGNIQIKTGDQDWDFALAFSQQQAAGYLMRYFPQKNIQSGEDHLLSPLDALYLLDVLTPMEPETARLVLERMVNRIEENGLLPEKNCPNHTDLPAVPLVAELAWQAHQNGVESDVLLPILAKVESSLEYWFQPVNDRDQDGIPELIHPCQLDLIDSRPDNLRPQYALQGYSPYLESPGLSAILYHELSRLDELRAVCGQDKKDGPSQPRQALLKDFLDKSWSREEFRYQKRDRDNHLSLPGKLILDNVDNGFLIIRESLPLPSRIGFLLQRKSESDLLPDVQITLHGHDSSGSHRVEGITSSQIYWIENQGWAVSDCIYSQLLYVFLENLGMKDQLTIFCPSTLEGDISDLLPLWAKVIKPDQVDNFITSTLLNQDKYLSPYGIRTIPDPEHARVQLPWNLLLGQGLLSYKQGDLAADLFSRLMKTITLNLNDSECFFSSYNANTGLGDGSKPGLAGLVPIGFFLRAAGIQIINQREIVIEGEYLFPRPLQLSYRGMVIYRDQNETRIDYPGEKSRSYYGSDKQQIRMI
jgi:hypothetical protein